MPVTITEGAKYLSKTFGISCSGYFSTVHSTIPRLPKNAKLTPKILCQALKMEQKGRFGIDTPPYQIKDIKYTHKLFKEWLQGGIRIPMLNGGKEADAKFTARAVREGLVDFEFLPMGLQSEVRKRFDIIKKYFG